jgi:chaperonin GroES
VLKEFPCFSRGYRVSLVAANYLFTEDFFMMNKIRPLHDRVVVKRLDAENKSAGGIVIPDTAGEKPDQGEVVAIGKGKVLDDGKLRPLDVKVGDRILFGKYSGQAVKVEGTEYLVMREDDIMGVIAK